MPSVLPGYKHISIGPWDWSAKIISPVEDQYELGPPDNIFWFVCGTKGKIPNNRILRTGWELAHSCALPPNMLPLGTGLENVEYVKRCLIFKNAGADAPCKCDAQTFLPLQTSLNQTIEFIIFLLLCSVMILLCIHRPALRFFLHLYILNGIIIFLQISVKSKFKFYSNFLLFFQDTLSLGFFASKNLRIRSYFL